MVADAPSKSAVICVVGPTATGKSQIADALAEALDSAVISADAMQVYRGMDVGTAKMPLAERSRPLYMVDVASIDTAYSAALYQAQAREIIDEWLAQGKIPILCGGTGLYVRAVIDEMSYPQGDATSVERKRWEAFAKAHGSQALWEELAARDPQSAQLIHPHNERRVVRALEMAESGVSYAAQSAKLHEPTPHYPARLWGLSRSRELLYKTIDKRVDAMMAAGLLDEVRDLMEQGLMGAPTASQAIGYKELADYLQRKTDLASAVATIKRRTRHYAKRQMTWFKRDPRILWLDIDEMGTKAVIDRILGDAQSL